MRKRTWSILLAAGLVASSFALSPATAQDAPVVIPDVVQIDDPKGDANGVNDQDNAYGTPVAGEGDHVGPAGGNATDILKVWFTHTVTEVSLNIQVNGDPSGLAYDTYYRFSSNAGEGPVANDTTRGCLQWIASVNGVAGAYSGPTEGNLTDKCNVGTPVLGPLAISKGPDTTYVMTITFPRSYSPLLVDGSKLTAPFGVSRIVYANGIPVQGTAAFVTLDNTKRGADYDLTAAGGETPKTPDPVKPPKKPKPGKAKGCDKGKGKKKGCKPAPPAACAPYVPGDKGKDAEPIAVTDAATADAPIEKKIDMKLGWTDFTPSQVDQHSHAYFNLQVDTEEAEKGLWAHLEFPDRRDFDLELTYPNGNQAAVSGGFNPHHPSNLSDPGHGGESTTHSETLVGIRTADCGGYTLDVANAAGEASTVTLTLWLGEPKTDPLPEEGEAP
ncbi:MAG: hypothetical protein M3323_10865 [Actinomycetota bacterium]|nr:hypothetical protein [Actinomycetota bacterium]